MSLPRPSCSLRTSSASGAAAGWTAFALSLFVLLGSFLGGSTARWSQGIVIGAFALLLIVRPPRHSLGPALNVLAFFFLALAATAFLPANWFHAPPWRIALTRDLGLHLPLLLSPQPWLSLDCYATLLAGFAWIYYLGTLDADLRDIRRAARTFSGGIIALAALAIFLHLRQTSLPFWHNVRNFGPYPNRNQTGDLFGIATIMVLGCMQDDFRRGHKRWLFWVAGVGVLIAALILDFSRAGILILVLGVTAGLVRLAFRKWTGAGVAAALSVLLVLCATLLLFGGETVARFHLRTGQDESVTADYRWLIFRDVWTMIRASAWCGVGLGNFEPVFALYRDVSKGVTRSLHPESDWLWLWSEMGWPAIAVVLAGIGLFVRRVFPLQEGTNQRLRFAALLAGLLFLLHGCVDVSAHRFGTFLAGTFLLGLAQHRPVSARPSLWPRIVFRLLGIVLLLVGSAWFFAWRNDTLLPGYLGVENAKNSATFAERGHRFAEAVAFANRGLEFSPLDWQLYFIRGQARIGAHQSVADAVADFRRARFLEPSGYQLPLEEGKVWLGLRPTLALTAWREALRRRTTDPSGIYSLMFPLALEYDSRVLAGLADFAVGDPSLTITYLENIGEKFRQAILPILARDPNLSEFNRAQKLRLFALWSQRTPLDDLVQAVATHPEWTEFAWPGLARWHAEHREWQAAWELVRQNAPPPPLPSSSGYATLQQLEQQLYNNPLDPAVGFALYRAQIAAGRTDDALATLRHFTARSDAPAYFYYLQAQTWAAEGNYERAWKSWQDYQQEGERH